MPFFICNAPGCKVSTNNQQALKMCSRCQWARYCCREHQLAHWKACHKKECFPQKDFVAKQFVAIFCASNDIPTAAGWQGIAQKCTAALGGQPDVAEFLQNRPTKIILQRGHHNHDDDWLVAEPPDLYLLRVPQALLCMAEDAAIANPSLVLPNAHAIDAQCRHHVVDMPATFNHFSQCLPTSRIGHIVRRMFETTGEQRRHCVNLLQDHLRLLDWSQNHPISLLGETKEQADSLVGQVLSLDGGVEMIYVTPPVICFAKLHSNQLDWFNGASGLGTCQYPILQSPVVAYRCVSDGWSVLRVFPRVHMPFALDASESLFVDEQDAIFLKMFLGALQLGDVTVMYSAWRPAKAYALDKHLEATFCKAAHGLLERLVSIHPLPSREESYFLMEIGEIYEAWASRLLRNNGDEKTPEADQLLVKAARCYHRAALLTHEFYQNRFFRYSRYNALGTTLLRLDQIELAKRAFFWAQTDPVTWRQNEDTRSPREIIADNLVAVWDFEHKSGKERMQTHKQALKAQRKELKGGDKMASAFYYSNCSCCRKDIKETRDAVKSCSVCKTSYCSKKCQKLDWPNHKKTCRERTMMLDSPGFWDVGSCNEDTNRRLALVDWTKMVDTMSLHKANQEIKAWAHGRPNVQVSAPLWIAKELEEIHLTA